MADLGQSRSSQPGWFPGFLPAHRLPPTLGASSFNIQGFRISLHQTPLIGKSLLSGFEEQKAKMWSNQKGANDHHCLFPMSLEPPKTWKLWFCMTVQAGLSLQSSLIVSLGQLCSEHSWGTGLQLGESVQSLQSATLVLKRCFQPRSRGKASKWRHSGQAQSWTPCLSNQAVEDRRWAEWVPSTLAGFLLPTAVWLSSKDQSEVGHFLPWRALRGGSLSPSDHACLSLVYFSKFLGLETFPTTSI